MKRIAWVILGLFGCAESQSGSGRVVCEGSTLDPEAECDEGFCVDGAACVPIFDECGEFEVPLLGGGCQRVGLPEDCWDGWRPDGEGGCEPILPSGGPVGGCSPDCPMGTMPIIGEAECQPVGPPQICWPGWFNDGDGGCEPILPADDCPDGTMPIIGEATCQPIGDCGAPPPVGPTVRHVDAALGPYTTIQEAVAAAEVGDTVFVAPGEYFEDVQVSKSVTIEGRCAELVTVRGTGNAPQALRVFSFATTPLTIRGLTITGSSAGLRVEGRRGVRIEDVAFEDCEGPGLEVWPDSEVVVSRAVMARNRDAGCLVFGARVEAEDIAVLNTRAQAATGLFGRGWDSQSLADVTVLRGLFSGNRESAVFVDRSFVELEEVVLRDTLPDEATGAWGSGVVAQGDTDARSVLEIQRSLVAGNRKSGLDVVGSTAILEEVIVRDTLGSAGKAAGVSVKDDVWTGAAGDLELTRSLVVGNAQAGVVVAGATAKLDGVAVRDTRGAGTPLGFGVVVQRNEVTGAAAHLDLHRSLVGGNRSQGIWIASASATLEDVVVRDTRSAEGTLLDGRGVGIQRFEDTGPPSELTIRRALVVGNREAGIIVDKSSATLEEVVVCDTLPEEATGLVGTGMIIQGSRDSADESLRSDVKIVRSLMARNRLSGVAILGSVAELEQVVVRDTDPEEATGLFGRGISVQCVADTGVPSELTIRQSLVARNRQVGLSIQGSTAGMDEVIVRDTASQEVGKPFGRGIGVEYCAGTNAPSELTANFSIVSGNRQVGVAIIGSTATLDEIVVRGTAVEEDTNGAGDGIAVLGFPATPASAELESVIAEDNEQAGVFLYGANASLTSSLLRRNTFSVAFQAGGMVNAGGHNLFIDNEGGNEPEPLKDREPSEPLPTLDPVE